MPSAVQAREHLRMELQQVNQQINQQTQSRMEVKLYSIKYIFFAYKVILHIQTIQIKDCCGQI